MTNLVVVSWDEQVLEGIIIILVRGNNKLWGRKIRIQEGTNL